jgi:hypothetical protein
MPSRSSLREGREGGEPRDNLDRLDAVFTKLGCRDEQLKHELLTDQAVEVVIQKLEVMAEKPGTPGASPTSRIRNYLKACEDPLEAERERVRGHREDQAEHDPDEVSARGAP